MQDIQLTLTLAEINQLLDALGQKPYVEVFELIAKLQQQAETQLAQHEQQPATQVTEPQQQGR